MPDPGLQRSIRKRASQACQQCRLRKVKCDIVEVGPPCHNCRFDGSECTTSTSRRSRKYRLQKGRPSHIRASQPPRTAPSVFSTASSSSNAAQNPVTPSSCIHDSPNILSPDGSHVHSSFVPVLNSPGKTLPPLMSAVSATARTSVKSTSLPSYIRCPRRNLRPDELEFLKSRGALSIPDPPLRDKLFLSFLLYVNPFLPVVDVQEVINAIGGESGAQVSLILFQAIMFAGSTFVDFQILLDAGFENRMTARAHFFETVKARQDNNS